MNTRDRLLGEAMALFGTQGYAATSIAQIESAAGLSAGSGGLYKHFRSKQALLEAGVRERVEAPDALPELLGSLPSAPSRRDALRAIAMAGLARLDAERDLNRILVRDLARFPDLLELFREGELTRLHAALTPTVGSAALAAVLISAISHYWLLADVYGGSHPLGISREQFAEALADLAASASKGAQT